MNTKNVTDTEILDWLITHANKIEWEVIDEDGTRTHQRPDIRKNVLEAMIRQEKANGN